MTDAVTVAIIAVVPPSVLAGTALWVLVANHRSQMAKTAVVESKVTSVEEKVDGRYTELLAALLKLTQSSSFSAGEKSAEDKQALKDAK
jgi:hypothetical protein